MAAFGIIYCITNTVNGKQYVGQTTKALISRWRWHLRYANAGSQGALHASIRKYGTKVLRIEQIDSAASLEELNKKETSWIAQLNTFTPHGYNLTRGGDGVLGWRPAQEAKDKMSRAAYNRIYIPKKFCKHGHPLDKINTYISPNTKNRCCLTCAYLRQTKRLPEKLRCYV